MSVLAACGGALVGGLHYAKQAYTKNPSDAGIHLQRTGAIFERLAGA